MSTSATRALKILKALKGHTLTGLSNNDLAKALDDTPSNITRAIDVLVSEGLVTKLETGRFSLSIQALQIAVAHAEEVNRANNRISEINQRIYAGINHD